MPAVVKTSFDAKGLQRLANKRAVTVLTKQAAYTRGVARRKIKIRKNTYSKPGTPPHSRRGQLKRAIKFGVLKSRPLADIGPTFSGIGRIGQTHEFGGTEPARPGRTIKPNWVLRIGGHGPMGIRRDGTISHAKILNQKMLKRAKRKALEIGSDRIFKPQGPRTYPARPFMRPTFQDVLPVLPKFWKGAIGPGR